MAARSPRSRPAPRSAVWLPPDVTIIDALHDPALFGALPAFRDLSTWARWVVFLKAVYGLPLAESEETVFRHHTGRTVYAPPPGGFPEAAAVVGRQAGKDRIAALITGFEALRTRPQPDGTELYALGVAQDLRGATRTLFRYACAPFEVVPMLRDLVTARTSDTLHLANNVVIAAYPCRPPAVRGIRAIVAAPSELAFFRTEAGAPVDTEMLRAIRPTLATTGGKLIILSSPYGQYGALWDLYRKHWGRDDSTSLVWQARAPEMNPTLAADYLARMEQDDPDAYRSEVLGEFRAGLSVCFDPEALDACVGAGIRERPPADGIAYAGFVDPSGGRRDRFALAIAHHDGARAVLDVCRAWVPPFNPSGVVAEAADLLRAYGVGAVQGDAYSGEFVVERFKDEGIGYLVADRDKSRLYLELLAAVNAGRVVLLDVPDLLRELRGLERRRGTSGRDRVDHPAGGRDDCANACAGALRLAALMGAATAVSLEPTEAELAAMRAVFTRPGQFAVPAEDVAENFLDQAARVREFFERW